MGDTKEVKNASLPIVVVGGGLAGCMCALLLGRRGLPVLLLEQRSDFRRVTQTDNDRLGRIENATKRSINLALSYRGISALRRCGLFEQVEPLLIPMKGRYMHNVATDKLTFQPYGTGDQAIFSVSRHDLNQLLMSEIEKLSNVTIRFSAKVYNVSRDGVLELRDTPSSTPEYIINRLVIGADGIFSRVRGALLYHTQVDYSRIHVDAGYKELCMPPNANGDFALANPNGLHIWPRGQFMLIALPNPDKSFTCTLFAPQDGANGVDNLRTKEEVMTYFETYFPDVIPLMPTLVEDFFANPTSTLSTIRCRPWYFKDKIVVLGDAAHAVVPFYGQGMNAAFEDCLVLDQLWEKHHGNIGEILPVFSATRQPACDALADLSIEHYDEMRSHTASRLWLTKKAFEKVLHAVTPSLWVPEYTLVSFTNTPYHEARHRVAKQDRVLYTTLATIGVAAIAGVAWAISKGKVTLPKWSNINGAFSRITASSSSSSSSSSAKL